VSLATPDDGQERPQYMGKSTCEMDVPQAPLRWPEGQGGSTSDAHWSLLGRSDGGVADLGAIDNLDLRIPKAAKLSEQFAFILGQDLGSLAFGSRRYERRVELSRLGWGLNLNLDNKKDGHHKLELLGVGKLKLTQMVHGIREVFDVDPYALEIMRVDTKADTPDYSVTWFYENARVKQNATAKSMGIFMPSTKASKPYTSGSVLLFSAFMTGSGTCRSPMSG
jgi:hypothetical protein